MNGSDQFKNGIQNQIRRMENIALRTKTEPVFLFRAPTRTIQVSILDFSSGVVTTLHGADADSKKKVSVIVNTTALQLECEFVVPAKNAPSKPPIGFRMQDTDPEPQI